MIDRQAQRFLFQNLPAVGLFFLLAPRHKTFHKSQYVTIFKVTYFKLIVTRQLLNNGSFVRFGFTKKISKLFDFTEK